MNEIFSGKRRVFLLGDFTLEGICFSPHDSGPMAGRYSIDITRKGPLMSLSFPTSFKEEGIIRITSGTLHHQPKYYDEDLNFSREPSDELRAAYKAIQKTLRQRLKRATLTSPIWISSAALELVDECRATVLVNGKWVGGPLETLSISPRYPIRS
jgi:hypothetical protein